MSQTRRSDGSTATVGQYERRSCAGRRPASNSSAARFAATVKASILDMLAEPDPDPTIVAIANQLSLNVRTLQRRLESAGVPFRDLLSECRRERALRELSDGKRSISEVSVSLGYTDPAHFARAFRRWTGKSPIEYRRLRRTTSDA